MLTIDGEKIQSFMNMVTDGLSKKTPHPRDKTKKLLDDIIKQTDTGRIEILEKDLAGAKAMINKLIKGHNELKARVKDLENICMD